MILLALFASGPGNANDLLLPDELALCTILSDQELLVYGKFESWVGDCLNLEDSTTCFVVDPNRQYSVLRGADYRSINLVLRVRRLRGAQPMYSVTEVERGPEPTEWLSARLQTIGQVPIPRRLLILASALRWSERSSNDLLQATAAEQLGKELAGIPLATGYTMTPQVLADVIDLTRRYLGPATNDSLQDALTLVFERAASDPLGAEVLRSKGYVRDRGTWRPESAVLAEIGMVRVGERFLTLEASRLDQEAARWLKTGRNASLLRSLTPQQYGVYAKTGEVRDGMNHAEAMTAWGYAERVTWQSRDTQWFEAWFYGEQWICFVDGLAFSWSGR